MEVLFISFISILFVFLSFEFVFHNNKVPFDKKLVYNFDLFLHEDFPYFRFFKIQLSIRCTRTKRVFRIDFLKSKVAQRNVILYFLFLIFSRRTPLVRVVPTIR